jgi:nucleotide-binding universal stress UspA family protein
MWNTPPAQARLSKRYLSNFIHKFILGTNFVCSFGGQSNSMEKQTMHQKKILVPLDMTGADLKSVHYALALAERIEAQVFILQSDDATGADSSLTMFMGEALSDLINSARQAGLNVSHHIAHKELKEEIVGLVKDEHIDLLVFGVDEKLNKRLLLQVKPLVSSQIIQVSGKKHIH